MRYILYTFLASVVRNGTDRSFFASKAYNATTNESRRKKVAREFFGISAENL